MRRRRQILERNVIVRWAFWKDLAPPTPNCSEADGGRRPAGGGFGHGLAGGKEGRREGLTQGTGSGDEG